MFGVETLGVIVDEAPFNNCALQAWAEDIFEFFAFVEGGGIQAGGVEMGLIGEEHARV